MCRVSILLASTWLAVSYDWWWLSLKQPILKDNKDASTRELTVFDWKWQKVTWMSYYQKWNFGKSLQYLCLSQLIHFLPDFAKCFWRNWKIQTGLFLRVNLAEFSTKSIHSLKVKKKKMKTWRPHAQKMQIKCIYFKMIKIMLVDFKSYKVYYRVCFSIAQIKLLKPYRSYVQITFF